MPVGTLKMIDSKSISEFFESQQTVKRSTGQRTFRAFLGERERIEFANEDQSRLVVLPLS